MTIDIRELKIPKRPKVYNGIDIKGVNFGMAWHSVHWSRQEDLSLYVESYWKKEALLKEFAKVTKHIFPYIDRRKALRDLTETNEGYKQAYHQCNESRKNIRKSKWEAIGDELLIVYNDNPWGWPLEQENLQYSTLYQSRPRKGDLLMCIDAKDRYRSKDSRVYNVIQDRVDYTLKVFLPESHSIVDTVLPLSFYT